MKLRMTLGSRAPLLSVLSTGPQEADQVAIRARMLRAFRAGELPSLRMAATVWTDGTNKNHYVLPEDELKQFAASFANMPFLKDHSQMIDSRGGTIIDSVLVKENGVTSIRQTIEAVKDWAIQGVLDGTIDRFSIGWDADEVICSICNDDIFDCKHGPWAVGTDDEKAGATVEAVFRGITGVETSAVVNPASPGTETEEVMAALTRLAEARPLSRSARVMVGTIPHTSWFAEKNSRVLSSTNASGNHPGANVTEVTMLEKVLRLLGLPANTSEPDALTAMEARLSKTAGIPKALCVALGLAETASETEVIARVVEKTAPGAYVEKAAHDAVVSELSGMKASERVRKALTSGKLAPANEAWALELASRSPEAFDAFFEKAPVQIPLTTAGVKAPTVTNPDADGLTAEERSFASRMGCDAKAYAETKRELATQIPN